MSKNSGHRVLLSFHVTITAVNHNRSPTQEDTQLSLTHALQVDVYNLVHNTLRDPNDTQQPVDDEDTAQQQQGPRPAIP
jgi:hypothetical protein